MRQSRPTSSLPSQVRTSLAQSLDSLGYDPEDIDEVLMHPSLAHYQAHNISTLPHTIRDQIVQTLATLSSPSSESDDAILREDIRAIFAYGTLRGDFSPRGDKWGVTQIPGCTWRYARVEGFRLYQNPSLEYPFAVEGRASNEAERSPPVVRGTLLQWIGSGSQFAQALRKCNEIEGYIQGSPYCLYQRRIVAVTLEGLEEPMAGEVEQEYRTRERAEEQKTTVVQAYMYFQDATPEHLAHCTHFEDGDWMR